MVSYIYCLQFVQSVLVVLVYIHDVKQSYYY